MSLSGKVVLEINGSAERVPVASHVRGTVLVSSQRGLKTRGFFDAYQQVVAPEHRDALAIVLASSWIPMEVALAHYNACEALALPDSIVHAIGYESGQFIYSSTLAIVARGSRQLGASPWAILANLDRFLARSFQGSAYEVVERAPKEAEVRWYGQPCVDVPYFRRAFGAFILGCIAPFCRTAYDRHMGAPLRGACAYRFSWV
jgi:hypothetical protein